MAKRGKSAFARAYEGSKADKALEKRSPMKEGSKAELARDRKMAKKGGK